ncbi:glycoside hydrolase family 5 protein [Cerasicoccus maritimus]|uniref:glycoside hydrolase family 5 protein n=1 Tax=Cerasicoccus maritimus TaxID=490089 RepID=UPI002852B7B8|nr:cellulase family glycosylhydrolase [Cerasicoccus maritimus]
MMRPLSLALILLTIASSLVARDPKKVDRNYPTNPPAEAPQPGNWPAELKVTGNRLTDPEGNEVWLQGVAIPGLEITPNGHGVTNSAIVAIEDWNANVIRVPIKDEFWYGRGKGQTDGGLAYRAKVDSVVQAVANRGAYIVLDHHRFRALKQQELPFWQELATLYKNHPAVIFDIINEPHGISWEVWRNGGWVDDPNAKINEAGFLDEATLKANRGFESPGMQKLVDAVRATGAKNIIIAGGLQWSYDLSGILDGYALDDPEGHGIMYATHIYNWKTGWQKAFLDTAEKHPIFVGEVGADVLKMDFIPYEDQEDPYTWVPDMLGVIQKYRLNWTGWSFHTWATPVMLSNWQYEPSPFWGAYAKRALAGERFEVKRLR